MLTLSEAAEQIRARQLSPVALTQECLRRIERLNPPLNAFITVTADLALQQAQQAEAEVMAGNWRGPLHGIPIGLKDLFDTAGIRTTAASNQYRDRIPCEDAELVKWLQKAGAVIVGKLNLHEFAFGGSGLISAFGPARNPWDTERITGGSSSGSAAAVAAGLCIASIGTDTACSVRSPAALCGIVGFRPSTSVLGGGGAIPLARSFDTAGPLTRTVRDAAVMVDVLAGQRNSANGGENRRTDLSEYIRGSVNTLKVGVPRIGSFYDVPPDMAEVIERALKVIQHLVAEVREVPLQVAGDRTIFNAEIYEYHEAMVTTHPELYDPRTLPRIQKCAGISATDYIRAIRNLAVERKRVESALQDVDSVITPTVRIAAPRISELEALPTSELRPFETKYLLGNTAPFSSLDWPSVSVPCGFTPDGLPVGLQISAKMGADSTVLRLAHAYEQATEWHKAVPPIARSVT